MTTTIVVIFLVVYLGMILGGLPFVQLDRTGVALLGAIAMISFDAVGLKEAAEAIHLPTIILLFSFMVISARSNSHGHCCSARSWSSSPGYRPYSATISCALPLRRC